MIDNEKYFVHKLETNQYNEKTTRCIKDTCQWCIDTALSEEGSNSPLMMLGKIQSGKTRAFTGVIALAFDNGFDIVLVLTKNSTALVRQTYKRMRKEFYDGIKNNEVDVHDIMNMPKRFSRYELNSKKMIIIAKKQTTNLDRVINFINEYAIDNKQCLVIDDEADTTGIGFEKVKGSDDEFTLRAVSDRVNAMRGSLKGYAFVQVTATPYSLYLQPEALDGIEPIKPTRTVLVPSGENYIGGEYYFIQASQEEHEGRYIFGEVSSEEHTLITLGKEDRRRFKIEEILIRPDKLQVFKRSIMNFIVGGCMVRLEHPREHFAFAIHTNTQKSAHSCLEDIVIEFLSQMRDRDEQTTPIVDELIRVSYEDIIRSMHEFGFKIADYEQVKQSVYEAIDQEYINVDIVNCDNDMDALLDEDTGELRLRTPFSIFVGGQVLDRGITIPNLIGFYYGRNPKKMQQDTVLQHSRMFGYRTKEQLAITRFYTTKRIYECMKKITEIDMALREDIEAGRADEGVYFIERDAEDRVIPCSPSKVALSNIICIKPHKRILPVGFTPKCKTTTTKVVSTIAKLLQEYIEPKEKMPVKIPMERIREVIELVYSIIDTDDKENARFISKDQFMGILDYMHHDEIYVMTRYNRQLSKYLKDSKGYQDAPDNGQDESKIAKEYAVDVPVLIMLQQDGQADGWNGAPFWWPVLIPAKDAGKSIYAQKAIAGRVRKRC